MKYQNYLLTIIISIAILLSSATAVFSPKGVNLDVVTIYGVSTSIQELSYQPKGSKAGGTTIYITCSGHNMVSTQNQVMVGPYECMIPEKGVTATTISCITTEAHDETRLENQPVELFVTGKQQSICRGNCVFHYKEDATPYMRFVSPSASAPNRDINWNGVFKVGNTIDIKKMIIGNEKNGDYNCNRFQLRDVAPGDHINLNDNESIKASRWINVPCTVARQQIAGLYQVKQENKWGTPVELPSMNLFTRDGQRQYQFVVTPEITSVSQNSGGSQGTELLIQGQGFGFLKDEVSVSAGGLNCEVLQLSNTEIVCKVTPGSTETVNAEQPGQFIKGQGATLTYYQNAGNARQLSDRVRNGEAQIKEGTTPQQIGSWELPQLDASTSASIVGYFYAPRTGAYRFWASGDDSTAVYLNTTPQTPSTTSENLIINACSWKNQRSYFSPPNDCDFRSEEIQLVEGNYYWLESYVQNGGGAGSMIISVETPAIAGITSDNTIPPIMKYSLVPEKETQKWSVKVWGVDQVYGLKFFYRNPENHEVEWDQTTEEFNWSDWTVDHFRNQINSAAGGFSPVVEEFPLDNSGNRCNADSCDVQGKEFVIEFQNYRQPVSKNQDPIFSTNMNSSNSSITKISEQYIGLSGHYIMTLNSEAVQVEVNSELTTNIPYNANSSAIKNALVKLTGQNNINVEQSGSDFTGYSFVITFTGNFSGNLNLEFETFLVGEKPGTIPQIVKEDIVSSSSQTLFYEPITFDFMYLSSDLPSIIVTVDGIESTVTQEVDNSYQQSSENTPIISSYSVSGNTLNLSLAQGSIAFENSQVQITYGYAQCENYNGSSCTFASDIEGGDNHQPIVYVNNVGYAIIDSGFTVPSNPVPVSLTNVSPSTGSINGGIQVVITGSGFSTDSGRAVVKFSEEIAQIISISTTEITVILPPSAQSSNNDATITVEINGAQNTEQTFSYSTLGVPTVTSISPEKASPVQKGTITITGTNYGSVEDDIKVQLFNLEGEKVYDLFLQTVADTQIEATLSGGRVGDYKLKVYKNGLGYSVQDIDFSYKIEVNNVQPTQGSLLGGTVLTITGQNFSTTMTDNLVFITNDLEQTNDVCKILTATNTEITCVTPPKNDAFDENQSLQIFVQGRLIEESVCEGNCAFSYSSSVTPSLALQEEGALTVSESTISVTGTGFGQQGNTATLQLTPEISIEGTVASATELTFDTPTNVPAGEYGALVSIENLGYAGIFLLNFEVVIENVEPAALGLIGGIVTVTGKGFDTNAYLTVGGNYKAGQVISQTTTEIVFLAPPKGRGAHQLHLEQGGVESLTTTYSTPLDYQNQGGVNLANPDQTAFQADNIVIGLTDTTVLDEQNAVVTPKLFKQGNLQKQYTGIYASSQLTFTDVPAGNYILYIEVQGLGFMTVGNVQGDFVEIQITQSLTVQNTTTGLYGGNLIQIQGAGFDTSNLFNNDVRVCGYQCQVQDSTTISQLDCLLPVVNTEYLKDMNQEYPTSEHFVLVDEQQLSEKLEIPENKIPVTMIADNLNSENFLVLKEIENVLQQYESSGQDGCFVGYNFGDYIRVDIQSIVLTTDVTDLSRKSQLYGAKLQVSNDNENWTDILEFSKANLKAYTYINKFDIEQVPLSQYVRFYNEESSYCGITGLQVSGFNYYRQQITNNQNDFICDVSVNVNGSEQNLPQKITYSSASSSTVESISPYYGWQLGGTEVTITGENFGTNQSAVSVYFDDIECVINSVSNTQIVCTTGDKGAENYAASKIAISVNGINSIIPQGLFFYYGLLWSEDASWGLEAAPRAGDSVYIGKGRTLIIDQSSPIYLNTVINEGRLIFADNGNDLEFHAKNIINQKSEFIIGTEFSAYQSNLTISLYGSKEDKQLPQFGVKVIACHKCKLDIHGQEKTPNWTFIETTVNPGDSTLTTKVETNWQVGDRLALATTDFDGRHSEEVFITAITHSSNGDSITFTPELRYTHISLTENYDTKELNMWAEIGNLSRNIVIQGNPEDNDLEQYGGHVMMHGEGAIGRIENTEFTKTGQAQIIGRYTMHFHMVGDSSKSYIRGNAVHNAHARIVALHDIRNLRVEDNVSYWVQSHNIFLENGIETDNQIHRNLIISPRAAFNMLQTDITVAGIWITNPSNYVTYNHVAGSEFYGLWYEIFARPETPNSAHDICPIGMPIGSTDHNVAHSNERFGLRIFRLASRTYPCEDLRDESLEDPWSYNPSIQNIFTNHTLYKNGEAGLLAEEVGNTKFQDFILADNYFTAFQAHIAGITEEELILEESIVVGQTEYTQSLSLEEREILQNAGQNVIVAPRKDGLRVRNIKIYNQLQGSNIVTMASQNTDVFLFVSGGKHFNIEGIQYTNCDQATKVKWVGPRYNLIQDEDGSFSGTGVTTYIAPYYSSFDQPIADGNCLYNDDIIANYQNSVVCTGTRLRSIPIRASEFGEKALKVLNLNDSEKVARFNTTEELPSDFGIYQSPTVILSGDTPLDFEFTYATDYAYNIHWDSSLDWSTLQIKPSLFAQDNDKTIIMRFNYTEQRELFDVFRRDGNDLSQQYEQLFDYSKFYNTDGKPNSSEDGCTLGQFYVDPEVQTVSICINNKGRTNIDQQVDVNGVFCRHSCPRIEYACEKESTYRLFTNEQQWLDQNGNLPLRKRPEEEEYSFGVPQSGDDVIIPCPWTVVFNVEEFQFGTLTIDGTLIIDEGISHSQLIANNIWVRSGKIVAGNDEYAFNQKFDIVLTGNNFSPALVIDDRSRTGTKSLAVTGRLELYGQIPEVTQTRLTVSAQPGDSSITVEADLSSSSWKVGDELVLGGSTLAGDEFEKVVITGISENTLTLESAVQYFHYGAEKATVGNDIEDSYIQVDPKYGSGLDMRTVVGHISRNIRILGDSEDSLGGHLQVYHWIVQEETEYETIDIDLRGSIVLSGVEMNNMGQVNSENAGIHIIHTNNTPSEDVEEFLTLVKGSSISDCVGMCANLLNTRGTQFENNIFYHGQQYIMYNLGFTQCVITNNVFIGAVDGTYGNNSEPISFIYMWSTYQPGQDGVSVTGNVGQSSQEAGFVFPATPCEFREQNGFTGNEAGNLGEVGFIYTFDKNACLIGGYNHAYHCTEGVSAHSKLTTEIGWSLENQILVENGTGVIMRSGSNNNYLHHNYLKNTYVSGMVLGEICPECYSQQNNGRYFRCSGQLGALMLLTNLEGNAPPLSILGALGMKALCNAPVISSQVFINDCEFYNFRDTYSTEGLEEGVCGENTVFTTNAKAAEATAAHFLKNTSCTNCQQESQFYLREPNPEERGWFGGCGIMDCTGQENVMVQDLTGDFLGVVGTAISNNEAIGYGFVEQGQTNEMQESCEFIQAWNGFLCERDDFVQLQWESIGPDAKTIDTAPVYLENDSFRNTLNMWKEWEWIGPEPQNMRQNSFVSLALVNKRHTLTYSTTQSMDIIHKLSQRNAEGEQNRYIIIESQYTNPLTIEVLVNGEFIPPFSFKQPGDLGLHTTECGRNNYYYTNSTIHFVVTNSPACQVEVRQVNHVQVNARISITEEEFLSDDNSETTFINRIAAFLSIPFDRIRIVGIVSNNRRNLQESQEVQLEIVITGGTPGTLESNNYDGSQDFQELNSLGSQLVEGINSNQVEQMTGGEYTVYVVKKAGVTAAEDDYFTEADLVKKSNANQVQEKQEGNGGHAVAIALGVIFGLLAIILVVLIAYHFYSKRALKQIKSLKIEGNEKQQVKEVGSDQALQQIDDTN